MSQFLFNFIQSLSRREKAYFKRYGSIHGVDTNKNYLKIYDAIEQMNSFQKGDLKAYFNGTSIEKYLSSETNYLKNKLLTSLINFHSNNAPRNKVQKGILSIQVLIAKGFRKEAMKKLKHFKKIAYQQEEFSFVLNLIELEEDILFKEGIFGFKDVLKKLKEERNLISTAIQNLTDLRLLREEIRELQFTEGFITDGFKNHKELYENPILDSEEHCLSIKATAHWYYIHALKYSLVRDYKSALKVSKKYISFLEKNNDLFHVSKQLPPLSNYIYFAAKVGNKEAFDKGVEKLNKFSQHPRIDSTYIKYIQYSRQFAMAYFSNDLELTARILDLSILLIKKESKIMGAVQVAYLLLLIVRATIVLGKYELGAEQLNQWYQLGMLKYLAVQARLFSLIIHYRLGWNQLLSSEIILLKKMKKGFPRDKDIINAFYDFFNKELKNPNQTKVHSIYLQKKLKVISIDKESNFVFDDFEFHEWSLSLTSEKKKDK